MPELTQTTAFEFRDPAFALLALLAPLVYWLASQRAARVLYSSLDIATRAPRSWRAHLGNAPAMALALATVALAIASAGPRTGDTTTEVTHEGIAIMLAVDRSGSMDARDFVADDYSVSRLDAVKRVLRGFIAGGENTPGRPHDLMGLVAFGTYADGASPLTLDHGNLLAIIDELAVAQAREEAATAIGEGLGLAVERLRAHPAASRVIVLLTDGVNNAGAIEPLQAAELAANHDIRVYTVGAGTNGVAPMPARTASGRVVLRPQRVEIDERTLEQIASRTGGRYFNARDAQALDAAYAEIDRLERSEVTELRYLEYHEHYGAFVAAALLLIALAELSSRTWLRRLP